jgi:hypothetical protein
MLVSNFKAGLAMTDAATNISNTKLETQATATMVSTDIDIDSHS